MKGNEKDKETQVREGKLLKGERDRQMLGHTEKQTEEEWGKKV